MDTERFVRVLEEYSILRARQKHLEAEMQRCRGEDEALLVASGMEKFVTGEGAESITARHNVAMRHSWEDPHALTESAVGVNYQEVLEAVLSIVPVTKKLMALLTACGFAVGQNVSTRAAQSFVIKVGAAAQVMAGKDVAADEREEIKQLLERVGKRHAQKRELVYEDGGLEA